MRSRWRSSARRGFVVLYAIQRLQGVLPFNPQGQSAVEQSLAFNTSVSFITNTNWQSYVPETTMSYLTQMAGLTVHNFLSAATGIALAIALVRGFARRSAQSIGNFWIDVTRCTLYILLPASIVVGLFFVWQGMPQNLSPYTAVTTLEGAKQVIAQGRSLRKKSSRCSAPMVAASSNVNSAHPYENPNALTNFIEMIEIIVISAALTNVFGRMVGNQRQGWAIFAVMGFSISLASRPSIIPRHRAILLLQRSTSTKRLQSCRQAAIWKARRCGSASPIRLCSRR